MKKKKGPSLFYWGAAGVSFHSPPPSQRKIALEGATIMSESISAGLLPTNAPCCCNTDRAECDCS